MSLTISIRFLTGRAHVHPWQTHHSEGRVEWPPSPWRLLRAVVAVAGRGLTSLPYPDDVPPEPDEWTAPVEGLTSLKKRGVPKVAQGKLALSRAGILTLKELLTDEEANAWKAANSSDSLAAAIDQLREKATAPVPVAMADVQGDDIPLSRLADLLATLSSTPFIWLPTSSGGHTRQYFPIHDAGMVKNTGSAVFDTFATVRKDQPLLFHWPNVTLNAQQFADLRLVLSRMTYFGRAESWCRAEAHACSIREIQSEGMSQIIEDRTHWKCVCIEEDGKPKGKEYRDYLLERRLAPVKGADLATEVAQLLPRTKPSNGNNRTADAETLTKTLQLESPDKLLLRCLLRESGQDIKDGLERPIGTRWIHYAVPREIYNVPRPKTRARLRNSESVDLVRYALNTATVNRPVLPPLTDTLLVADRFRIAVMSLRRDRSLTLSGHEADGAPCRDHQHAFWWPLDEDNDGFIDHVMVWARGGFKECEVDALRRLTRLRQRGGRPDLLVTPVFVGPQRAYAPWQSPPNSGGVTTFVSSTPYFCPVHLSHGRGKSGRIRSLRAEIIKSLQIQSVIDAEDDVASIKEIVFDYAPRQLAGELHAVEARQLTEPLPPRQYFPVVAPPAEYPPLAKPFVIADPRYRGAALKDTDEGYCFGTSIGLWVDDGSRFIRALSFGRRRRGHELQGRGRMLQITMISPKPPRPFAIGNQSHFGLGQFVPCLPLA